MSSKIREFVWSPRHPRRSGTTATRSTAWTRCPVPRNSPTASRCSPRTCCAPRTAPTSPRTTSRRSRTGIPSADPSIEIQFTPARVIMQDFTGVPCIVDLATMREAVGDLGGDPDKVNPLAPADLVIDHSVIADVFGNARTPSSATSRSSTSATASATSSCAGARAPSTTSRWCRRAPASCTRSTSSTWPAS